MEILFSTFRVEVYRSGQPPYEREVTVPIAYAETMLSNSIPARAVGYILDMLKVMTGMVLTEAGEGCWTGESDSVNAMVVYLGSGYQS